MIVVGDTGPVTVCCGTWPVARTPHTHGWLRPRYVTAVDQLDHLLTLPWVCLSCPACHRRIELP